LQDSYSGKNPDLSSHLHKLTSLARQPDLLYIAASVDEIGPIVQSIRNAGITTPIMGGDSYDTPLLLRVAGAAANSVYYTTHVLLDGEESGQHIKQFIAAYKAEFGVAPESAFAGLGYDAVMLLADAIKRAGTDQPRAIRQSLQATRDLSGVTGSISFAPDSHIPKKTVTLVAVKNQRLTLAAEIIPKRVPPP
jgi:branched-chain amino acid transport system substrate-binding protein